MARIVFALDHEEGHCFPTFKLARQLEQRGHTVTYLGLPDTGALVRRQGFSFVPILERFFPEGTVEQRKRAPQEKAAPSTAGNGKLGELDLKRLDPAEEGVAVRQADVPVHHRVEPEVDDRTLLAPQFARDRVAAELAQRLGAAARGHAVLEGGKAAAVVLDLAGLLAPLPRWTPVEAAAHGG